MPFSSGVLKLLLLSNEQPRRFTIGTDFNKNRFLTWNEQIFDIFALKMI